MKSETRLKREALLEERRGDAITVISGMLESLGTLTIAVEDVKEQTLAACAYESDWFFKNDEVMELISNIKITLHKNENVTRVVECTAYCAEDVTPFNEGQKAAIMELLNMAVEECREAQDPTNPFGNENIETAITHINQLKKYL